MPSLSSRAAAAKAAARADYVPCCTFCRATVDLQPWHMEAGHVIRHACRDKAECHARFLALIEPVPPVPPLDPLDGRETGRTALHAPESSNTDLEGT